MDYLTRSTKHLLKQLTKYDNANPVSINNLKLKYGYEKTHADLLILEDIGLLKIVYADNEIYNIFLNARIYKYLDREKQHKKEDFKNSFLYPLAISVISAVFGFSLGYYFGING